MDSVKDGGKSEGLPVLESRVGALTSVVSLHLKQCLAVAMDSWTLSDYVSLPSLARFASFGAASENY